MLLILTKRIKERGMTTNQLSDAIDCVIDTCRYPVPSIAEIVGYDKKIKVFTYAEVRASLSEGFTFDDYRLITKPGEAAKFVLK